MTETEQLISGVNAVTEEVNMLCDGLSVEQMNARPDADGWSIAQVLEHLILVFNSYDPVWKSARDGRRTAPWPRVIPGYAALMGRLILSSVQPQNRRKAPTMSVWKPSQSAVTADILGQFLHCQEMLKAVIIEFNDMHGHVLISSPANRNVIYSLGHACRILVAHEARHVQQIKRIANTLKLR